MITYYISGHGFGHATRSLTIIEALLKAAPSIRVVVRTSAPASFLKRSTRSDISIQPAAVDTGMTQIDSLRMDVLATARSARVFYDGFEARVESEARVLRELGASLVIGDIPPLAFAAAARAGPPSVAIANFTWDWIYEAYPEFEQEAPAAIRRIRDAYALATLTLRLPFCGGFEAMTGAVCDIPLVARRSRRDRAAVRALLELPSDKPIVLSSFGGHGAAMPYEAVAAEDNLTLILTEREAAFAASTPRLRRLTVNELDALDLRYEDLVAAADLVVSKPGYGIVSECIANRTPLLYTSRGNFVEQAVLVEGVSSVLPCREIGNDDLLAGRWQPSVAALLSQPAAERSMDTNGAEIAAGAILEVLALR